jgi:DNA repair protein RecO (recombination protein O)
MRYLNTKGLILRKQNRGENDYYLTIHSPDLGKINAVSKSSRKILSHQSSHLDVMNISSLQLYNLNDNYIITQCQTEKSYLKIKENYQKSIYAQIVLEIFQKCIAGDDDSQGLFQLLTKTLDQIETGNNEELYLEEFKIKFLNRLGTLPQVAYSFFSGKKWSDDQKIWIDQLGHLSAEEDLSSLQGQIEFVPFKTIKLIHFISQGNILSGKFSISADELKELKKITNLFIYNYLHQEIRSEKILTELQS